MRDRDVQGDVWFRLLLHELAVRDIRQRRAHSAASGGRVVAAPGRVRGFAPWRGGTPSSHARWSPITPSTTQEERRLVERPIVALLITLAVVATALSAWYLSRDSAQLVSLPAGQYVLPRDGTLRRVATTGFAIQRFEVTNQDYRRLRDFRTL